MDFALRGTRQRVVRPLLFNVCALLLVSASATALLASGGWSAAGAQTSESTSNPSKVQSRLDANRNLLKESQGRVGSIKESMAKLDAERATLNTDLIQTGDRIKNTERQLTEIEQRLGVLETKEKALRTSLGSRHDSIARLLGAMQRMGRNPPPVIITQRSDALRMVRSAMLLAKAFPTMRTETLTLSRELNELVTVLTGIREQNERLRMESTKLKDEQTRLGYLLNQKRQSLDVRRLELKEVEQTVDVVGRNVASLEQLLTSLNKELENTRIGRESRAADEARPPVEDRVALNVPKPPAVPQTPSAPATPAVIRPVEPPATPPEAGQPVVKLAPEGGFIGDAARLAPAVPFHLAKGRLPLPAEGKIETHFGDQTQFSGRSKGLVIQTRFGAQITSPSDGWVVYAGKFRTYKQLLIIRAGNGYHVLLAGLSRIDVRAGQFVLAAEPVGTMRSTPGDGADNDSPRLYIEFRKDGRPINPQPWWSAEATQKVQG